MTESLLAYIPTDRRHALARGADLPRRTTGAALFADISGFTPLTEALVGAFGPQRGAEELLVQLNRIYDALVAEVDDYRGSVLAFSGDAITCWFDRSGDGGWNGDAPSPVRRATTCALAMQRVMARFASIEIPGGDPVAVAVKVAVAAGPVVRFVVGDPAIQSIDALAGETLQRLAAAEHRAERGEVVLDRSAVTELAEPDNLVAWRNDDETGERFAVVAGVSVAAPPDPWPVLALDALGDDATRRWLLPPVANRLTTGMGEFLTELRPAVALFLRFTGIDYDGDDDAGAKLDAYIRAVQVILARFESYVLQLTIGDKGSYLYTAFGAPIAHEDDAVRAVTAALEIRALDLAGIDAIQIGVAQGRMRTGAYGGVTRRTYGVLGDDVNISARLMQHAAPNDVLVEQAVRRSTLDDFLWDDVAPIAAKGKTQPVAATRLVGARPRDSVRLHEPHYALQMVGRRDELALFQERLDRARAGQGQLVGVVAEAGMGKSRLIAEVIASARGSGVVGYGGECQSYGVNAPYLVWQNIWRTFFGLDAAAGAAEQIGRVETVLGDIDAALVERLPLLGPVLNLTIPDTALTETFDANLRKASLESLLVDCLRARVRLHPLLLVLEDCHWLDPLSRDLLEVLALAAVDLPVLIVCAYRPALDAVVGVPRVDHLPHFTGIALGDLPLADVEQLVRAKLDQVYRGTLHPSPELVTELSARGQGNPFYIEELLNYLNDREIDPTQPGVLAHIDLPDSLYSLILGRIDRLTDNQQTLIKIASVIGRLFPVAMLWGVHPSQPERDRLLDDLSTLNRLDLTALDSPEPELTYLFKHVLTQEVAYETLAFATRARLHGQIGAFIEQRHADTIEQQLDFLAHHYDRSEDLDKRRQYLRRAGEAARAASANVSAISYFERVLPLLDGRERVEVLLLLGQVHELVGDWHAAGAIDREALDLARLLSDEHGRATAEQALGWLERKQGDYAAATSWMALARATFERIGNLAGVSHVLADIGEVHRLQGSYGRARVYYDQSLGLAGTLSDAEERARARAHALRGAGTVAAYQGDYVEARRLNEESLQIRRTLNDKPGVAVLLNNLAILARFQHDLVAARAMNDESLALSRELGDRWALGQLLNNQACVAADQGDHPEARALLHESLAIRRQLGDRAGLALSLNTLADVVIDEGDHHSARPLLQESMAINRELGDQTAICYLIEDYAGVAAAEDRPASALQLAGFAAALRDAIGAPLPPGEAARVERMIAPARNALTERVADAAWNAGRRLGLDLDVAAILEVA